MIKNFIVLLTTFLILLIAFEIALRLFKPQIFDVHPHGMYITDPHVGYVLKPGYAGFIERDEFSQYFKVNEKKYER